MEPFLELKAVTFIRGLRRNDDGVWRGPPARDLCCRGSNWSRDITYSLSAIAEKSVDFSSNTLFESPKMLMEKSCYGVEFG